MKQLPGIVLSPADRAALERLAKGESRAAFRAKAVLALADGESVAGSARRLKVTPKTVRAALARFRKGGVGGLRPKSPCGGPVVPALKVPRRTLRLPNREAGRRGRLPRARGRIEAWVRDSVALGFVAPGARLPERAWFRETFGATAKTVQAAFDGLAAQGFVRAADRRGTFVADRLPFAGRFLLVLEGKSGMRDNLERAARRTEALRPGVRWDVVWRSPKTVPEILRGLRAHRWCGAFLRTAHTDTPKWSPGHAQIASVPNVPIAVDSIYRGTKVSPLVRTLNVSRSETWGEAFAAFRRAGRRRFLVVEPGPGTGGPDREADVRAAAAEADVAIPKFGYLAPVGENGEKNLRRIFGMALALTAPDAVDAILVRRDDFLKPLSAALRERWGAEAASRVPVVCWSVGDMLPAEGLAVEWRGPDLPATLLSFIGWCEAVRAGAKNPPDPAVVR